MLNRIKDFLCHPSRIGLYHKDKGIVVAAYIVVMMILMIIVAGVSTINQTYFTKDDANTICTLAISATDEASLEFKNKKLKGSEAILESKSIDLVFLGDGTIPKSSDKISLHFFEEKVNIYLGRDLLNELSYNNIRFNDFTFKDLKNNDLNAKMSCMDLMYSTLKSVERDFLNLNLISGIITYILSYLFLVLIVVSFSYMSKPDLSLGIRMRICIYGTLIYFLLVIFKICLKTSLFELLAFMVPVFYTNIAFSRIIKVKIRKD